MAGEPARLRSELLVLTSGCKVSIVRSALAISGGDEWAFIESPMGENIFFI